MYDLVKVEGLGKRYDGFALDRVSLKVPAGCVVGFVGSNGAGKTTTIKSILGIVRPDAGNIALFGEPTCGYAVDDAASTNAAPAVHEAALARAKARIGVVFDTCPFPTGSCVVDVERIGRFAFPTWRARTFKELAGAFGLDAKKQVNDLSRGMGMKLQLAFALAHAPELLVLDEVTAGLDPLARDEVLDILRDFMAAEGHGILMSSHITSDLEKIADYVVCIDEGRLVFSCAVDDITDAAGLVRCGAADVAAIASSGLFAPGALRVARGSYAHEVLVPDRALLSENFPQVACERASIDDYMRLMLKGEAR
ncbi:MAG: ATP-binding cassette domain-containing protein [Eggerthellaceae bacterium]|nr:ATP-binding cassette domain-containing protein [Eggerthellaceae bacterium]